VNRNFYGDSYDIVKRFFCTEIAFLGYSVRIEPMLSGESDETEESAFYRFIGSKPWMEGSPVAIPGALFLDPDTGVRSKDGEKHVSFKRIAEETKKFQLVFAFDQSFSRQAETKKVISEKIAELGKLDCCAMYYNSHARFLFASADRQRLCGLRDHLIELGLPAGRLILAEVQP
jgi:hypothetical protein